MGEPNREFWALQCCGKELRGGMGAGERGSIGAWEHGSVGVIPDITA